MAPYVNATGPASVSSEKFVEADMSIPFVKGALSDIQNYVDVSRMKAAVSSKRIVHKIT